ncbi:hypothetical protein [Notoacmeibacter ruber]|uniref:Uncharacterized protein n=1 Tax=Notoacmeibacter ruber TaxID=2670375 RepID=A0A3L7JD53_9HYPH|nr:hypothetical protein [Notoacmeibacter ruber]RLQ88718.1 hypothetical protein D8780_11345 [Notoacmeibacter ruber]
MRFLLFLTLLIPLPAKAEPSAGLRPAQYERPESGLVDPKGAPLPRLDPFAEANEAAPEDPEAGDDPDVFLYGEERRQKELDDLFETLAKAPNAVIGKRVAGAIQEKWNESGSATIDYLLEKARGAMRNNQHDAAMDLIGEALVLNSQYAEAWNLRATLHFLRGDMQKSMADIQHTLALEPRHFGALTGMAAILQSAGRDAEALAVYDRALEVFPTLESAKEQAERLRKAVDNQTL